jgi:hypothetical protein
MKESEAAAFVLKQFKGRIVLTVAAVAGASFVLGALLF